MDLSLVTVNVINWAGSIFLITLAPRDKLVLSSADIWALWEVGDLLGFLHTCSFHLLLCYLLTESQLFKKLLLLFCLYKKLFQRIYLLFPIVANSWLLSPAPALPWVTLFLLLFTHLPPVHLISCYMYIIINLYNSFL